MEAVRTAQDGEDCIKTASHAACGVYGHEITHVLEGTDMYDSLRTVLYDYAKAKGEYDSRRKALEEIYKGVEEDIDAELTADLVGDYLFQDADFVGHLSTKHRNIFQKIYDEIKYLCKVVTAGSKEARQLEKVKKAFDEAYRASKSDVKENTAENSGVKYSLSIKHTDGTVEELADARNLTNEQAVEYLEQAKRGELRRDTYIPVRKDTPQVIIDTLAQVNENVSNRSLIMQVRKAQQAMSTKKPGSRVGKNGANVRSHGLNPKEIVEIIDKLDNPSAAIYQTNRTDKNGQPLSNNVAVFVEYNSNGNEGVAVIEFESSIDPEAIGTDFGDTNYHTVVTVFEPDVLRDGMEFDYAEELLSNPNNTELEIKRRQSDESATGEKHPNTSSKLPSKYSISQNQEKVNTKLSLSSGQSEDVDHFGLVDNSADRGSRSLDKFTEKQYNSFGWARDTGAITKNELDDMYSKIHVKGSLKGFAQTSYGEAIIEVNDDPYALAANNVFAFVKGTKNNPEITRVVRVNFSDEASIDLFRKDIYENTGYRTLETYARRIGEEYIQYYDRSHYADYRAYTEKSRAQRSGSGSKENTPVDRNGDQRSGSPGAAEAGLIAPIKKASSTDGVFFDAENTNLSLSANGERQKRYGTFFTPASEVMREIAPVREDPFDLFCEIARKSLARVLYL